MAKAHAHKAEAGVVLAAVSMVGAMYQARPTEVHAVQFTGENVSEVARFLEPDGGPYNPKGATAAVPISVCVTVGPLAGRVIGLWAGAWLVRSAYGLAVLSDADFQASYVLSTAPVIDQTDNA